MTSAGLLHCNAGAALLMQHVLMWRGTFDSGIGIARIWLRIHQFCYLHYKKPPCKLTIHTMIAVQIVINPERRESCCQDGVLARGRGGAMS